MDISTLKQRKKELKMTLDELSKKSGIAKRTLEDIFRGATKNPRIDTLQAIERALGLTAQEETQKNPPTVEYLTEGEKALLDLFNRLPADKQDLVLQMIQVALKPQG